MKIKFQLLFTILAVFLLLASTRADVFTSYMHLSHYEQPEWDRFLYFETGDTLYGPVHSNDRISLRGRPVFLDHVSTCASSFINRGANPYFAYEPRMEAYWIEFPESLTLIRNNAAPFIPSRDGRLMTWIQFRGENGIDIFQYPRGTPRNDSL